MHRSLAGQVLIAAIAVIVAAAATYSEPARRLELAFSDSTAKLFSRTIDSDIVIVAIDPKSLADVGQWPWPRRLHAELLDRLAPAAPARLFLDIDFSARSSPGDDEALERALADWPGAPVVLPAFLQQWSSSDAELVLTEPLPALRRHTALASVNLQAADDGLVRSVETSWQSAEGRLKSVSSLLGGYTGEDKRVWIDYTVDPASFHAVSYSDVIENRVPAQYFAGKTVFVGATAIELGDVIPVPVHKSLPGVVVQALALESMINGSGELLAAPISWSIVAIWTLLLAFTFRRLSWRRGGATAVAALLLLAAAALVAQVHLATIVPILPFAVSAIATYLMTSLASLESASLRALMYSIGFRNRDALLKSVVQSSTDCIVCVDADCIIRTANPAASTLFRCDAERLVGSSLLRFVPKLLQPAESQPACTLQQLSDSVVELMALTDGGEQLPVELSVSRVQLEDELLYTAIVRDVSERHAQQRQLRFQATHDALTALPNRPALAAHLDALLHGRGQAESLALLMIDLNRFKEVNDTLGHNVGDYVLHEVAQRLGEISRDLGFIARIGGDEFALVVDDFDGSDDIANLSQALVDCLRSPVETSGVSIDIGMSIGIALYPADATNAEELFRYSDVAMYVAKRANTGFEFYDAASDTHSLRRLEVASKLRSAVANCELRLHYQPQVNLRSGDVDSVEALIRWNDSTLGVVGPDEFIPVAETTDLIEPLSELTMVQAFNQSARWHEQGLNLRIAVNISARLLQNRDFPAQVARLLHDAGAEPCNIELEITESAMMQDPDRALRVSEALSELGVQISIDDFGTGYSSLSYLRDLPAHAVKLDKSFVVDMHAEEGDRIIAASTVQMAHALNLKVVAEGVETPAVAALLRDMGYDYAQGYLYCAALEPEALESWLDDFRARRAATRLRQTIR